MLIARSNITLRQNAAKLIAINTSQIELNIDMYLEDIEDNAALLFADETYYTFDPTDDDMSDYDKILMEDMLDSKILDLGLLENYSDFGIVYANGDDVGWISQVTRAMFTDADMYETFSNYINNSDSGDSVWVYGVKENKDHLYYLKQYNDSAIIAVSFYVSEFENVFVYPEQLSGMNIRLVNDDDMIIYSTDYDEIGQSANEDLINLIRQSVNDVAGESSDLHDDVNIMTDDFLVTCNMCNNGWRVICTLPNSLIIVDNTMLQFQMVIFIVIMVALILLFGLFEYRRVNISAANIVDSLSMKANQDGLTGLYNKTTFQMMVDENLKDTENKSNCFIMMDIDNFKQINDKIGHIAGDRAIKKFADIMKEVFDKNFVMGRIGGDEFAILGKFEVSNKEELKEEVSPYITEIHEIFDRRFSQEKEICDISVSLGIVYIDAENSFNKIYDRADKLLYNSKKTGKNTESYD